MENESTFDNLVSGIGQDERAALLSKMKNVSLSAVVPVFQAADSDGAANVDISKLIKEESLLYKFMLFFRSLFSKKQVETLYSDDLLAKLAKKVTVRSNGMVDCTKFILTNSFCERLHEMKDFADFFKPYLAVVNDFPGEFYVFISSLVAPEVADEIKSQVDPCNIPLDTTITSELRMSRIRSMEKILRSLPNEAKAVMYDSAVRIEWLNQFCALSFIHFITLFTDVGTETYTCHFSSVEEILPEFARIFSFASSVPTDILQALFLFYQKKIKDNLSPDDDTERELSAFIASASGKFSKLQSFLTKISFNDLGKIVYRNYNWHSEKFGGAEDWFQKFHDEWRHIFDDRWDLWLKSKKKHELGNMLRKEFGIDGFPELPCKTWETLRQPVSMNGEITGGFLLWFSQNKLQKILDTLRVIVLEGSFMNVENRKDVSDNVDYLTAAGKSMEQFVLNFSLSGKFGRAFEKLSSNLGHSMQDYAQIDAMIGAGESQIMEASKKFCDGCRFFDKFFDVVLDGQKVSGFLGIQNLRNIKGPENESFVEQMQKDRENLKAAYNLIAEVEPLDLPKFPRKKR